MNNQNELNTKQVNIKKLYKQLTDAQYKLDKLFDVMNTKLMSHFGEDASYDISFQCQASDGFVVSWGWDANSKLSLSDLELLFTLDVEQSYALLRNRVI